MRHHLLNPPYNAAGTLERMAAEDREYGRQVELVQIEFGSVPDDLLPGLFPPPDQIPADLTELKRPDLERIARAHGLSTHGKLCQLRDRLEEARRDALDRQVRPIADR